MATEKSSESGKGHKTTGAGGDGEEKLPQRPVNRFSRHYYEYKNAVCKVQMDAARKRSEADARFADASQHAQKTAFKPAQDAYVEYLRVFQRGQMNPADTGTADVFRAQSQYVETYHRSQESARKVMEERRKEYVAECEAIQKEMEKAQHAAFTDYVRAIKESWGSVDPQSFDAQELGATAHSMISVATCVMTGGQLACTP